MKSVTFKETEQHNIHNPDYKWLLRVETITVNGHLYTRGWNFWPATDKNPEYEDEKPHFSTDTGGVPTILCGDCQKDLFQIFIGNYSVVAKCCHCGKEEEVYSG